MDLLGADQEEKRSGVSVSSSHTRTDTEAHGESSVAFSDKPSYLHSEAFIHGLDECVGEGDEEGGEEEGDEEEDEEEVRMFKLRRHLDQLDSLYTHTEESMLHAREELRVCAERIAELQGERQALEELTNTHTHLAEEEEDSVSVFAMRAQLKSVCEDLHSQEELHTQLAMELRQHQRQLCQVGVQMNRVSEETRKQRRPPSSKSRGRKESAEEKRAAQLNITETKSNTHTHTTPRYIQDSMDRVRRVKAEQEEKSREELKRRTEAVLALKESIAHSQDVLRVQRRRECVRSERREKREQEELQTLKAAGANTTGHTHMQTHLEKMQRRQEEVEERQRVRRMEIVSKLLQEEELREKGEGLREKQMQAPPPATQSIVDNRKRLQRILQKLDTPAAEPQPPVTAATQGAGLRGMSDSSSDQSTDDDDDDTRSEEEEDSQSDESLSEPTATEEGCADLESDNVTQRPHVALERTAAAALVPRRKNNADTHTHSHTRPPFSSKPHVLHFKDFELGKVYRRRVVLTNVTYSTNHLRLLGLTHTLNSCIALSFQPPGPMSPGMSCEMEAIFSPVLNVDLEGDVCFTSAAGDFSLPVRCSTKKCQVSVDCSKVLFGSHVVGQRVSRSIVLTNSGARGTRYLLLPVSSPNHVQTHHTSPSPSSSTKMCVSRGECEGSESPQHQTSDNRTQQHTPDIPSGSVSCVNEGGVGEEGESVCVCESPSAEQEACSPEAASPDTHTHTHTHTHTTTHTTTHTHTRTLSLNNSANDAFPEIQLPEMREGVCAAFSKVKIPLLFHPMIPGDTHLDFIINFSEPDCPPISVSVCGTAVSAPVCVVDPDLDLKICSYGRLYQHTLTLHSSASRALRVVFSVSKELRRHMEILPKTAYIQAHSTYQAQLKFLPRLSLREDAGLFFHKDTGVLEAPLTVTVAEQTAPLRVCVHAVVTGGEVVCDPPQLDFGFCTVQESVTHTLTLTNTSLLPQDYGFIQLPKFLEVQPGDGFGTLLPQETLQLDVIFSPHTPGEHTHTLTLKTHTNREFGVCVRGVGVKPVLELSHTLVEFRCTAVGDESSAVLYLTNTHTSMDPYTHTHTLPRVGNDPPPPIGPRDFCFCPPQHTHTHLTITPATGRLQPGERCLVQVRFSPSLPDDVIAAEADRLLATKQQQLMQQAAQQQAEAPTQPVKKEAVPDKKGAGRKAAAANRNAGKRNSKTTALSPKEDSPPSIHTQLTRDDMIGATVESLLRSFKDTHTRYVVPCYISDSPQSVLYLEVRCPVMRPPLVITDPPNTPNTLHYNQVLLDEKVVKKVTIQNISEELLEMTSSVLDLTGPFMLLNALRPLRPQHTHTLLIAFTPTQQRQYREVLELHCSRMSLRLTLCGEGVEPMVTCSHQGPIMDFGHLMENDITTQVIKLYNGSVLPVKFSVLLATPPDSPQPPLSQSEDTQSTDRSSHTTERPTGVFAVCPDEAVIPPGKSADVNVTFQPQHTHTYTQGLTIQLSNKQTVCAADLRGVAQKNNMYLSGGDQGTTHTDDKSVLVILRSEGGPVSRSLELACIRTSQPVAKKNVEFMWEGSAALKGSGFSLDPPKGNVEAGGRKTLNITYTPSKAHTQDMLEVLTPLTLKGHETEIYNVTLQAYRPR